MVAPKSGQVGVWRHSQVVRQRSAKPLSPSSNLGAASNYRWPFRLLTIEFLYPLYPSLCPRAHEKASWTVGAVGSAPL